jgi:aspartyl protease family protein
MKLALFLVIAAGAAIGLMLPSGQPSAPVAADLQAPAEETLLEREEDGHFYVDAEVNGQLVHFLIDTGATTVALTTRDAARIGIQFDPDEFEPIARGASGLVRGKDITLDSVDIEGKRVTAVRAAIAEGLPVSLLGQAYLARISTVQMNGDYMSLR